MLVCVDRSDGFDRGRLEQELHRLRGLRLRPVRFVQHLLLGGTAAGAHSVQPDDGARHCRQLVDRVHHLQVSPYEEHYQRVSRQPSVGRPSPDHCLHTG